MYLRKTLLLTLAAMAWVQSSATVPDDPIRMGTTLRVGFSPSVNDHLSAGGFGFGLNATFPLGGGLSVIGEAGYWSNTGKEYTAPFQAVASGKPALDPASSTDARKNSLMVLHLRGLCRYDLGGSVFLQGGIQLGRNRFRHEYVGQYTNNANGSTGGNSYTDTCNGTPTESSFGVSPVLGLEIALDKDSALEVNLVGIAYRSMDFRHTPGSALVSGSLSTAGSQLVYAGDTFVKNSRMTPTVELGYTFRF
jgi:hypothetical protein